MGINSGEERCANTMEAILFVWYMVVCAAIAKLLCKAKVNHIDQMRCAACAHDEICGLDVAVDEGVGMNEFDTRYLGMREDASKMRA